jgi:hydrogenase nickel incorporation protein HypA/HybF
MHELPVTENILEVALKHAAEANASNITNIYLVIGQMASIIDDSVEFYWDIIAKGTIAEGARLHFKRIPTKFQCVKCNGSFVYSGEDFTCPNCGSLEVKVIDGEQFYLEAIDIENK